MKKLLSISGLLFALLLGAQAQAAGVRPSDMTASGAIVGTQLVWCPTPVPTDFKCTFTQVATFLFGLVSGDATATAGGALTVTKFNGGTALASAAGAATGTSGATLPFLNGTNTWSGIQTFGNVFGTVSTQAGTTYTLAATDCGTEIAFTNAAAVTVTIPATLTTGCNISILQTTAAGQVTVTGTAVSAAVLHSGHSYTKTFGQWSIIGINIYTTGVAILTGDGA